MAASIHGHNEIRKHGHWWFGSVSVSQPRSHFTFLLNPSLESTRRPGNFWGDFLLLAMSLNCKTDSSSFKTPVSACDSFWRHGANRMPDGLKKMLIWLGQRSYGIYMWHMMFLTLVANGLQPILGEGKYSALPLAVISSVLTIVVCQLSYKYYGLPFLKLKERFGTPS